MVVIKVSIGTHEIELWPEGESLRIVTTWHKTVILHAWRLSQLIDWSNQAKNDEDYIATERKFIQLATGSNEAAVLRRP